MHRILISISLVFGFLGLAFADNPVTQVQTPTVQTNVTRSADQYPGRDIGARVNTAIADVLKAGGGIVRIPASNGCLAVDTQINLPSGIWLRGEGRDATCLSGSSALGPHQVIKIEGTPAAHAVNIVVSDMTIKNGTPSTTAYTAGMDGIRADYADRVEIRNLHVTSVQGAFGIAVKNSSNVFIHDNEIDHFTYAGIVVTLGSNHIVIDHNLVDTATLSSGNAYGIVAAGTGVPTSPYPEWVWVQNNTVRNIPIWEGLDAHGGQHLWFTTNTISNVQDGIMVGIAPDGAANPVLRDVHIEGNKIVQGSAKPNGYGIIASGVSAANMASDIWIVNNDVTGFGATASASAPSIGAIELRAIRNAHVIGNTIRSYNQYAVLPYIQVWDSEILNNVAYDMVDAKSRENSAMVGSEAPGIWGLKIDGNKLMPSTQTAAPAFLIRQRYAGGSVELGDNYAQFVDAPASNNTRMLSQSRLANATPTVATLGLGMKNGDAVHDKTGKIIGHAVAGPGFWSRDNMTVISTGDMTAGENIINNVKGGVAGAHWDYSFPAGMNITVLGAGPQGGNLNAQVKANDGTRLTLDTPAATTITGAAIKYQAASTASK